NQYALSDDGIGVRGADHGIGDESRRHLGGDDLTRADRLALLHVLGSDEDLDELPFLAGALLACAQRSVHPWPRGEGQKRSGDERRPEAHGNPSPLGKEIRNTAIPSPARARRGPSFDHPVALTQPPSLEMET